MKTKNILHLITASILLIAVYSCKKQVVPPYGNVASLNIVNALPTSLPMIPVQGTTGPVYTYKVADQPQYGRYENFKGAQTIGYGGAYLINPVAGNLQLYLVQYNADTIVTNGHVSKFMFNKILNLPANTVHSLFITGNDTSAVDYVLTTDQYPIQRDSTCGIRFINLSTGSNPVSVDIQGQGNGSEVSSLNYKAYTSFKTYAANSNVNSYTFEFRDADSRNLLTTYTLSGVNNNSNVNSINTVVHQNMTIALIGQPNGTGGNGQQAILVPQIP